SGFGGTPTDPRSGVVWAQGNILMGGGKNDVLEGRDNDDVLDGDHSLNVYISVHSGFDPTTDTPTPSHIPRTDLMEHSAMSGSFGLGVTPNMTLEEAVFADPQIVNPGQLEAVREIHDPNGLAVGENVLDPVTGATTGNPNTNTPAACNAADMNVITTVDEPVGGANCDIAEYSAGPENYGGTVHTNGSVTVSDTADVAARAAAAAVAGATSADILFSDNGDGVDTLWNIEALRFCVHNDPVSKNCDQWFTDTVASLAAGGGTTPV